MISVSVADRTVKRDGNLLSDSLATREIFLSNALSQGFSRLSIAHSLHFAAPDSLT
jgi:hypothetical protein